MTPIRAAAVRVSELLYRVLLLRYPREMRVRYGAEMRALFRAEGRRRVENEGLAGLAFLWWKTLRDVARPLPGPLGRRGARAATSGFGSPGCGERPTRWIRGWMTAFAEDFGFGLRSLVREPRFTVLVVGVLAVGIALNTAAFAALNAYVLRPLPFPEADRLVSVRGGQSISWTDVDDVFERAVSWDLDVFTIIGEGRPEMAPGAWVTPDYLEAYGVRAQIGRTFLAEEGGRSGAPVAMISHRLWQERFGGDPDIVGRSFSAFTSDRPDHAELFTVVGVLSADFWYLNEYTEVLAPIRDDGTVYAGRLRPDLPLERAEAMLTEIATRRMREVPPGFRVELVPLQELHVAAVRPTLVVLQAAVLLVLLIACANAAVLLLVRSGRRERELGVRRALGASGTRLARQLMIEGGLVAGAATTAGLALAAGSLRIGRSSMESRLGLRVPGGAESLTVDVTVVAAAGVLAVVVGILFGSVPLLTSLRGAIGATMHEGRRGGTESRGRRRFRDAMVAAEVALSLALLTGAGLLVQSALHLQQRDPGFDPSGVVVGLMGLREASYPAAADRVEAFSRLSRSIVDVPGVAGVGLSSARLFGTRFGPRATEGLRDGRVTRAESVRWTIDEGYFDALRIPIVAGRGFSASDAAEGESVAVVGQSLARDLWGTVDPIGLHVRMAPVGTPGMEPPEPGPWRRVIGVARDVDRAAGGEPAGDLYVALRQSEALWMNALVRFDEPTPDAVDRIGAAMAEVDPEIAFASVRRLEAVVDDALRPARSVAALFTGFSAFALLLAIVGLYGVVSYAARQRRRDVAIRMALGADRGSVTSLFVRQAVSMVAAGLAAGTVGALGIGRALESQLHGVRPDDPVTYGLLATLSAVSALVAVWIPARRAAALDPMGVLREE